MTPEQQLEQLTRAVSLIIYCLQRGPMWGGSGSAKDAVTNARILVTGVQLAQKEQQPR